MSTLWGPALDAEIAYRQERVRSAFDRGSDRERDRGAGRGSGRSGSAARAARRTPAQEAQDEREGDGARIEVTVRSRAARIRQGLAGMRPAVHPGRRYA